MSRIESNIRFGIMCNGTTLNAWQAQCINNLLTSVDNIEVALLIINYRSSSPKRALFRKIKNFHPRSILFQLYKKFFFKPRATRRVSLESLFSKIPKLRCKTIKKGKYSQYFSESDINIIRKYNLDFILRFEFGIIRGEILNVARYGVWSFHPDDKKYRGIPPCFWEIYKGDPVTGVNLQRLTEKLDSGVLLKEGFFKTVDYSHAKNLDQAYFENAKWPAEVCRDIRNNSADYLNASPSQTQAAILPLPNNFQTLFYFSKILLNFLKKKFSGFFRHEEWNIGIVNEPIHAFLSADAKLKVNWFPKRKKDYSLADPFAIAKDKKIYLFFEEFDYRTRKMISCMEFKDHDFFSQPNLIPNLFNNASYPYLLEYQGEIYCIPELWQTKEISLFKAKEFPNRWVKVSTLVKDIAAVDSTVFQYEGRWWITCTTREEGANLKLFLWYASDLFGPWIPHAANPVKTDIRSSRPAGTPFVHNNNLYRPSQDCSRTYGGGIVINRVIRLTPTVFEEEQVAVVKYDSNYPYTDGTHTISSIGNITIVDGKRSVFILSGFKHVLMKQLRKFYLS